MNTRQHDESLEMTLSDAVLRLVVDWRALQQGSPSRAAAVRTLIELGIANHLGLKHQASSKSDRRNLSFEACDLSGICSDGPEAPLPPMHVQRSAKQEDAPRWHGADQHNSKLSIAQRATQFFNGGGRKYVGKLGQWDGAI